MQMPDDIVATQSALLVRATQTAAELGLLVEAIRVISDKEIDAGAAAAQSVKETLDTATRILDDIDRNIEIMKVLFRPGGENGKNTGGSDDGDE